MSRKQNRQRTTQKSVSPRHGIKYSSVPKGWIKPKTQLFLFMDKCLTPSSLDSALTVTISMKLKSFNRRKEGKKTPQLQTQEMEWFESLFKTSVSSEDCNSSPNQTPYGYLWSKQLLLCNSAFRKIASHIDNYQSRAKKHQQEHPNLSGLGAQQAICSRE